MKKREFLKLGAKVGVVAAVTPTILLQACDSSESHAKSDQDSTLISGGFSLPELAYGYHEYEKAVDALTMEIHHSKHHQGYVNKLNAALKANPMQAANLKALLAQSNLPTSVRNNGGGHFNHTLFWESLSPEGKAPSEAFKKAVEQNFNSWDEMINQLQTAGKKQFGSGWAWLCQNPNNGKLFVTATANQDNPLMKHTDYAYQNGTPLLGIDVWEHAYYLRYQNKRGDYLGNVTNIINWEAVESKMA